MQNTDNTELSNFLLDIETLVAKARAIVGEPKAQWTRLAYTQLKAKYPEINWVTCDREGSIIGHLDKPELSEGFWLSEGLTVDCSAYATFKGDFRKSCIELL